MHVDAGFYVLVDYHPHAEGEPLLNSADSVDEYVDAWQRLWTSLTCLPNWESGLRGRVFLDLLNEPDALQITWDGSASTKPPLSKYYLGVMDAINCQSPGEALFFIQVRAGVGLRSGCPSASLAVAAAAEERAPACARCCCCC